MRELPNRAGGERPDRFRGCADGFGNLALREPFLPHEQRHSLLGGKHVERCRELASLGLDLDSGIWRRGRVRSWHAIPGSEQEQPATFLDPEVIPGKVRGNSEKPAPAPLPRRVLQKPDEAFLREVGGEVEVAGEPNEETKQRIVVLLEAFGCYAVLKT